MTEPTGLRGRLAEPEALTGRDGFSRMSVPLFEPRVPGGETGPRVPPERDAGIHGADGRAAERPAQARRGA
jgi:hypothetical protein